MGEILFTAHLYEDSICLSERGRHEACRNVVLKSFLLCSLEDGKVNESEVSETLMAEMRNT
jgi:hypothetical protein